VNILFVTERRIDAGSIQALANYVRVSKKFGHHVALYGTPDPGLGEICFSTDLDRFDHVVFIFESRLTPLNGVQLAHLLVNVPRSRRSVFDADGMYGPMVVVEGYDRNHSSEREQERWIAAYEALTDRILQPTLLAPYRKARSLLFYGYDGSAFTDRSGTPHVHLMYLGHNWWRWRDVSERLLPAISRLRNRLGEISFIGLWWDGPPSWAAAIGQEAAFRVDPARLRQLRITVLPPVPFREVIATMSSSRINIMIQRPLFRQLQLLTSKYFEVFAADTIPLVMLEPDHAERVYGPDGRELVLTGDIADKLTDVLEHPKYYQEAVTAVRQHLALYHSYERRLEALIEMLSGPAAE
jgi:Glycosyl transferases group 1